MALEGPFGDHTGYYSPPEPFPVFHLTCMTMRRDAIYPSIVVGVPPAEDAWLGKATERIFLPAIRMTVPEIVDYDLPVAGAFHNCVIVSIRKAFPGHAKKVMHAIWGLGNALAHEDGRRRGRVRGRPRLRAGLLPRSARTSTRAATCMLSEGPLDQLDHAAEMYCYGGKLGIDATHKLDSEGARPWPERIEMTAEVRDLVDARWNEYGIEPRVAGNGGISKVLRQTLRR